MKNHTRLPWKRFFMSYAKYNREHPWEAFDISRQGFEIALALSSKRSCQRLRFNYERMKQDTWGRLNLDQSETHCMAARQHIHFIPCFD